MAVKIPEYVNIPELFYRNYNNDLNKKNLHNYYLLQGIRIVKIALPFIHLFPQAAKAISLGAGSSRCAVVFYDCYNQYVINGLNETANRRRIVRAIFEVTLSLGAVAATVYRYPIAMLLTSSHDIGLSVFTLYQIGKKICTSNGEDPRQLFWENWVVIANEVAHLFASSFYLLSLCTGSIYMQIGFLSVQIISGALSSFDEYKKDQKVKKGQQGHKPEMAAHILMTAIRVYQLRLYMQQLRVLWAIEAAIKNFYVGNLREKWQFPSDHLPIGIEIHDGQKTKIKSFNVLNNIYMEWITTKDSQGLNGSMISDLDIKAQNDGLTRRDLLIIKMLQSMMDPSTGMIALQECGQPFLEKLQNSLPASWKIAKSSPLPVPDQDVILYNSSLFSYLPARSQTSTDAYPSVPGRPLQVGYFERVLGNDKPIRIVNSHIPDDPNLPCTDEFAKFLKSVHQPDEILVGLGDFNFERAQVVRSVEKADIRNAVTHSPWQTNIDPYTKESQAIDHAIVLNARSTSLPPDKVLPDFKLEKTISLLSTPQKKL